MKAAILSVGTELLFGEITNTNSVYLSQQLNLLGCDVLYHFSVGDNPDRLKEMIQTAFKDCDLIITSGGLGPTQDDLTKEVACETLHDELVLDEPTMKALQDSFKRMKKDMTENNKKQAYVPSRATVFDNDAGSAPGFALEENGHTIICLPGPPREMTRLYERKVKPYLESKIDGKIYCRMIRTIGIGESQLETELLDLIDKQTDPTLATYAKEGECCLRIASKRDTLKEAEKAVNEMLEIVKERIGQYIYSCDDEDMVEVVGKLLMKNDISISCAESCTGGLFAQTLIDIPGISAVFDRGFVTYSNQAKMDELGVKSETLEKYGAVSSQTAIEMAQGVKQASGSRLCISVTGIAGPDGGSEEKPVGLSYVGVVFDDKQVCEEIQTRNVNRKWNRNTTALSMLNIVRKLILNQKE